MKYSCAPVGIMLFFLSVGNGASYCVMCKSSNALALAKAPSNTDLRDLEHGSRGCKAKFLRQRLVGIVYKLCSSPIAVVVATLSS